MFVIILGVLMSASILILVTAYDKVDADVDLKIKKVDVMVITVTSIFCVYVIKDNHMIAGLITSFVLIMSALIDHKIQLIYTLAALIGIALLTIMIIVNRAEVWEYITDFEYGIPVIITIVLLAVIARFSKIGFGDILVYIVVYQYMLMTGYTGTFYMWVMMGLSNLGLAIELIVTRKKSAALVPHILWSWIFVMCIDKILMLYLMAKWGLLI